MAFQVSTNKLKQSEAGRAEVDSAPAFALFCMSMTNQSYLRARATRFSNRIMKPLKIIAAVILFTIPSLANELATSYEKAAALAEAQEKAPATRDYFNQILLPYYAQKYAAVFQSCFASVQQPDNGPFSFVAAFGADGQVVKIYSEQETNIAKCVFQTLKGEQFPEPPESPYYLHIDMRFTDAPESRPKTPDADAPPLVVSPNQYSYTFGVPAGWQFDFDQAHQRGAALAFFPKGGSFKDSSSVIYVNELERCSDGCLSPLSESITATLRQVRKDNPTMQVAYVDPVQTMNGGKATIRVLDGTKDPRNPGLQDHEALAFIGHDETIILVVLTTRDKTTWNQDYAAFRQVVAGHKFFTCASPELAVPCKR